MKLALIAGGSRGLGKALVDRYEEDGFEVYEFSRSGESGSHVVCDFSSPAAAAQILEKKLSELAKKDYAEIVLMNNAGTVHPIGPIAGHDAASWIDNININLNSAIIATGIFTRHFQNLSAKKTIANISSGAAIRAKHGWALYCAAKAGLEHFCRAVAMEQSKQIRPINVVLIDPGVMDTEMQAVIRSTDASLFPELERFLKMKEEGQLLDPTMVADKIFDILSGDVENGMKFNI